MPRVLAELGAGRKQSHWMWFIFPQIIGLSHSFRGEYFAIASLYEARAYLAHPLLGPRLKQCTDLVLATDGKNAHDIFGTPDDLKFRSSMTLFNQAGPGEKIFRSALDKYFEGKEDALTLTKLAQI
jgi:uncharacterized protein (DUF1810 family)